MTELPESIQLLAAKIPEPGSIRWRSAGHQQTLIAIAQEIRALVPIAGDQATNDEVRRRRELTEAAVEAVRRHPLERHWFTIVAEETPGEPYPPSSGVWADSVEEAIIGVVVWSTRFDGRHLQYAQPDDSGSLLDRYEARRKAHQAAERKRAEREAQRQREATLFDLDTLTDA